MNSGGGLVCHGGGGGGGGVLDAFIIGVVVAAVRLVRREGEVL